MAGCLCFTPSLRVGRVGADHVADQLVPVPAATARPLRSSAGEAAAISSKVSHLAVQRQMTGDFREPVIWLLLAIAARWTCWGRSA